MFCVSGTSAFSLVESLGDGHDNEVYEWKKKLMMTINEQSIFDSTEVSMILHENKTIYSE
jgi:predicted acylesterase/phospholipase RssA